MAAVKEKKDMTKKVGSTSSDSPIEVDERATIKEEVSNMAPTNSQRTGAQGGLASQVSNTPNVSVAPPVEDTGVEKAEGMPQEPLASQVSNTPNLSPLSVDTTLATEQMPKKETSLAEIYAMFNPKPKERTEAEQAEYERQRRATNIIMGISDAINGLSNLGATIYGAPSREVVSTAGKWAEALDEVEAERQKRIGIWRDGYMKAHIEDFKRKQQLADKAADNAEWERRNAAQHANDKALVKLRAEMDANAKAAADKVAAVKAATQHGYEREQIKERGKQDRMTANVRATIKAEEADAKSENKRPYFTANIAGTPVDAYLRNKKDYSAIYELLKPAIEKSQDAEASAALSELQALLKNSQTDDVKAASYMENFVTKYFGKYYDHIKDDAVFKHLKVEFRDSDGNVVEFKPQEPEGERDLSNDPITKNLNAKSKDANSQMGYIPVPNYSQGATAPWLIK